tara:strand:+ start:453 stop:695 length:243 start_codon:yes stop_codon:yes gene_type:complete
MNEEEIDKELEIIMKDVFQIKKINLEANMLEIPEWDSLKHIQLIMTIEEKFNITIDFTDSIEMTSIPIIKNKILKYLNDK